MNVTTQQSYIGTISVPVQPPSISDYTSVWTAVIGVLGFLFWIGYESSGIKKDIGRIFFELSRLSDGIKEAKALSDSIVANQTGLTVLNLAVKHADEQMIHLNEKSERLEAEIREIESDIRELTRKGCFKQVS